MNAYNNPVDKRYLLPGIANLMDAPILHYAFGKENILKKIKFWRHLGNH